MSSVLLLMKSFMSGRLNLISPFNGVYAIAASNLACDISPKPVTCTVMPKTVCNTLGE